MRYGILAAALAVAAASAAQAQTSGWGAFEAGGGAGVGLQGPEGAQLMLKCDKPGRGEVYAVLATPENLVPPAESFVMRPARIQFDNKTPYEDRLRFYEHSVVAINKGSERSLTRFLADLDEAKAVEILLYPDTRNRTQIVTLKFDVTGAKDAIAQVYASCKDQAPA